jgi:hypothetical protein
VGHQEVDGVGLVEGHPPGEHLEEHHPERVHVRRRRHALAANLLRRHVLRRTHKQPRLREGLLGVFVGALEQAEVKQLDEVRVVVVAHEVDVGGLEVAVDDPVAVGLAQGPGGLQEDVQGAGGLEGPFGAQEPVEGAALQVLHGHEVHVVGLAVVVEGDGVGVGELRDEGGFLEEALVKLRVVVALVVGLEHLEGDDAPEGRLLGAVHPAHAPAGDEREDLEAPVDDPPEEGIGRRLGGSGRGGEGGVALGGHWGWMKGVTLRLVIVVRQALWPRKNPVR